MMTKILNFYDKLSFGWKGFLDASYTCVTIYIGVLSTIYIESEVSFENDNYITINIIAIAIIYIVITFLSQYIRKVRSDKNKKIEEKNGQVIFAHSLMNNLVSKQTKKVRQHIDCNDKIQTYEGFCCFDCMVNIVDKLYYFLESNFSEAEKTFERIDFEVTFMTKSYIDSKITIPAFANREGRSPISLLKRKNDPNIYDNTVTASVYRDERPIMRIIPDTSSPSEDYHQLYDGQINRIKSSIVYPVLDNANALLGTLVVHCNRTNFFKVNEKAFWKEILEIFSTRLAFEKSRLDLLMDPKIKQILNIEDEPPF